LRKSLVAVLAAATVLGGTSAAVAQGPGGTLKATVKPGKAGTKKKPKAIALRLQVTNQNTALTADTLQFFLPKNAVISPKGLKACKVAAFTAGTGNQCSAASKSGGGTANAIAGVNTSSPSPLVFGVTAYLLTNNSIGFYLQQQGGNLAVPVVGKLSHAGGEYGKKLTIAIPQLAREFPRGVFNGLVSLDTTLKLNKGKHHLLATNGCPKSKRHAFKAIIGFQANPNPPSPASVTLTATAKCS
jgi:hypothetical protein